MWQNREHRRFVWSSQWKKDQREKQYRRSWWSQRMPGIYVGITCVKLGTTFHVVHVWRPFAAHRKWNSSPVLRCPGLSWAEMHISGAMPLRRTSIFFVRGIFPNVVCWMLNIVPNLAHVLALRVCGYTRTRGCTRTRPVGILQVRVGSGNKLTGTGIPVFYP